MFPIMAIHKAPTTVLNALPRPPARLAPPITQAAIAFTSDPSPRAALAVDVRQQSHRPPKADITPEIT